MSLQTCYCCGWSKVTSYQGLRIHQGRMGCTPTGVRVAEPEQKYLWGIVNQTDVQIDLKLDVCTSVKTDYYSDLSQQVCHCGWTKMATYMGLRIHQGKNGCTPKGVRIPKTEQDYWKDHWKQEGDCGKHPSARRAIKKQENFPEPPQMGRSINPTATVATIKQEYDSSSTNTGHRLGKLSTLPQVKGPIRGSAAVNPNTVPVKKKKTKSQIFPQNSYSGGMKDYNTDSCNTYPSAAVRIKKEPISSTPEVSTKSSSQNSSPDTQVTGFYSSNPWVTSSVQPKQRDSRNLISPQVTGWIKEHPQIPKPDPVVRLKEKHQYDQQVRRSVRVREQPSAPPLVPLRTDSLLLTGRKNAHKAQLLQEIQNPLEKINEMRKENMEDVRPTEQSCQSDESQRSSVSSLKTAAAMVDKSSFTSLRDSRKKTTSPAAAEQVNSSASKHLKAPPVVPPKKIYSPLFTVNSEKSDDSSAQELEKHKQVNREHAPPVVPPKMENPPSFKAEPKKSEPVAKQEIQTYLQSEKKMNKEGIDHMKPLETNSEQKSAAAEEDPASLPGPITAAMKVKDLARMFSVMMDEEKAARQKDTFREKLKHSQVKRFGQRLSTVKKEPTARQKSATDALMPQKASSSAAEVQRETPSSLFGAAKSGFITGMKVKELARMFSEKEAAAQEKEADPQHELNQVTEVQNDGFLPTTAQKTVVQPKEEEQTPTQTLPDSESATTISDPTALKATTDKEHNPVHEAVQTSAYSSGSKVKDLARMFSAMAPQDQAVQLKKT